MTTTKVDHALNYVTNNHFYVEVGNDIAAAFTECSGLSVQIKKEVYFEGGVNDQQRVRVGHAEFADVTLKRGVTTENTGFWKWASQVFTEENTRRNVNILVFNQGGDLQQSWTLIGAIPVAWKLPALQASGNSVVIEELTLAYEGLQVGKQKGGGNKTKPRDAKGYFSSL